MKINKTIRNLLIVILLATNIGCDQISKNIVRQRIEYGEQISVIDNFITLTKVENTGAFLSLGNSLPRILYRTFMIVIPMIVLIYALYYLLTSNNLSRLLVIGICLIVGGGVGNIIDRIMFGSVTDFLHFNFVIFHTGIVNVADISVTTGFFIILFKLLADKRELKLKPSK
jgi:signal peptidase II